MIDAVSRGVTIPKSFLAKIFQDLAKAGLLRSQRGAGGGFILARPPTKISILEVIEAIDGKIALQRCLGEGPDCEKRESCALCGLFEEAQDRLKEVFRNTSLADLASRQSHAEASFAAKSAAKSTLRSAGSTCAPPGRLPATASQSIAFRPRPKFIPAI